MRFAIAEVVAGDDVDGGEVVSCERRFEVCDLCSAEAFDLCRTGACDRFPTVVQPRDPFSEGLMSTALGFLFFVTPAVGVEGFGAAISGRWYFDFLL